MKLLAIDSGTYESAWVLFEHPHVLAHDIEPNVNVLGTINRYALLPVWLEMIASYGMPVGAEVFETAVWIGRFMEAACLNGSRVERVTRVQVKTHLCHSARAKDSNVWQAILDRFGGKAAAVGNKAAAGPLYGITSHARAALAVALYAHDCSRKNDD